MIVARRSLVWVFLSVVGLTAVTAKKSSSGAAFFSSPSPAPASNADEVIVSFDYMKEFMTDVFLTYGVPKDRAELSAGKKLFVSFLRRPSVIMKVLILSFSSHILCRCSY
jgi:hypothetical protein